MSPEAQAKFARIVTTSLIYARPNSAGVRLRIGSISHTLTLACAGGRFEGVTSAVEVALQAWFHEVFEGMDHAKASAVIAKLIRDRHEASLPKPPDPRRLPLELPKLAPTEGSPWKRHRRAMSIAR